MDDFAAKPTIEGERVVLRPVHVDDAEDFLASVDDEARRLTGTRATFTLEGVRAWLGSRGATHDRWDLAVVERATGRWSGELAIMAWSPDDRSCAFRIALAPHARDRGLGTEATRLVVDHVFEQLPIHRISLDVFAFNPRAARVYEQVGFRREGVLRDSLRWAGEFHDTVVMAVLRPDWEAARSATSPQFVSPQPVREPGIGDTDR